MVENIFWLSFDINTSAKYFFNKNHEKNMQRGFKSKLIYHTVSSLDVNFSDSWLFTHCHVLIYQRFCPNFPKWPKILIKQVFQRYIYTHICLYVIFSLAESKFYQVKSKVDFKVPGIFTWACPILGLTSIGVSGGAHHNINELSSNSFPSNEDKNFFS